jgi:threonine dehydrogenase-like Zn-dependent dehydrogenase
MRSVKMEGEGRVSVVEVPDPQPGPGEVVVKTVLSALCGSELHGYRGPGGSSGNGGHDAAGTVEALGPGVTTLQVGQRVGLSAIVGCGHCAYCAAGQYTWCPDRRFYGNMHAECILIAAHGCHPLADDVPWEAGVLLSGDGLGVPYHTSTRFAEAAVATVAIFGVGPIGLGHVLLQSYLGRQVIVVDLSPARLDLARTLGAAHTIDARTADPVSEILALTAGRGADVCVEAAGRPETLKQCFAAVRTGGKVAMNGEQPAVELSPSEDFIRRDITALGSWYYHFSEFPHMLGLFRQGLAVDKLITHGYSLAQADTAFREFAAGRTGKVVLRYSDNA